MFCLSIALLCQSCFLINQRSKSDRFAREFITRNFGAADSTEYSGELISKRKAFKIAKKKAFETFGYWTIIGEKPYNKYYIDTYCYVAWSLRKGWRGGVFMIIVDRKNGEVKIVRHGK